VIERDSLPDYAGAMGQFLRDSLQERVGGHVRDVRGQGLMIGIEVKRGSNRIVRDLAVDHRILTLPAGRTVLRLLPPLVVDKTHVERLADAVAAAVTPNANTTETEAA